MIKKDEKFVCRRVIKHNVQSLQGIAIDKSTIIGVDFPIKDG